MRSKFPLHTAVGIDGQKRKDFAANIESEIQKISLSVLDGSFAFQELRAIPIDKPNGKIRLINVPTIRDRFVQRVLIKFFRDNYSEMWKLPNSFSSMGGDREGAHDTLKKIKAKVRFHDYVIRADLSQFFDTINRDILVGMVKQKVRHRSLHSLIIAALNCETNVSSSQDRAIFKKSGMTSGIGIRQGMPISPVLAFLFLSEVDKQHQGHMFRYVDDMIFYHPEKETLENNFANYKASVEKFELKIHPLENTKDAKTKLYQPEVKINFLGIDINRTMDGNYFCIPSSVKAAIIKRSIAASKFPHGEKQLQKKWLLSASKKTEGLVRDYKTAYGICEDWGSFESALKDTQLAMCRSISKEVAILSQRGKKGSVEKLFRAFGVSS